MTDGMDYAFQRIRENSSLNFEILCSAPDPAGGAYSDPPDLLAGLRGATSKGRERKEWRGGGKR